MRLLRRLLLDHHFLGPPVGEATPEEEFFFSGVSIDSRTLEKGDIFFALPGKVSHGEKFIEEALRKGCSGVVVSNQWERAHALQSVQWSRQYRVFFFFVDSPLCGLQSLAHQARINAKRLKVVVGITGSKGKTTVKELVGAILSEERPTFIGKGNLNTETGLPLTLLSLEDHHEYGVLELGVNQPGDMDLLLSISRPTCGVVTGIGSSHLEFFETLGRIAEEKKKLLSSLNEEGCAVIPEDDAFTPFLKKNLKARLAFFGSRSVEGFMGSKECGLKGQILRLSGQEILLRLPGKHNLQNALAAVQMARFLGLSEASIRRGLEKVSSLPGRGEVVCGSVTFVEDYYNASPEAVSEVLSWFQFLPWKGRKTLLLGDMEELGAMSEEAHRKVGKKISGISIEGIFLIGPQMRWAQKELASCEGVRKVFWSDSLKETEEALLSWLCEGDLLLLKASRGLRLERLAKSLRKRIDERGGKGC